MARSPRARQRRHVLEVLSAVRRATAHLQGRWTVASTIRDFDKRDGNGNIPQRPREVGEYPENQSAEWAHLVDRLDDMINGLSILRGQAYDQYVETSDRTDKN